VKKWNLMITGNDGRKFYQNVHVVERSADAASKFLRENFPDSKIRATIEVEGIEEMGEAELFLPGIVYKSGRAYFAGSK